MQLQRNTSRMWYALQRCSSCSSSSSSSCSSLSSRRCFGIKANVCMASATHAGRLDLCTSAQSTAGEQVVSGAAFKEHLTHLSEQPVLSHVIPYTLRHTTPCYAMPCHVTLWHASPYPDCAPRTFRGFKTPSQR